MPSDPPDIISQPRWSTVRAAMKLLTGVADARTTKRAQRRFDQLVTHAEKSIAFTNATYVAAQVLRDMDVLSRKEATYVFRELFDLRYDEYSDNDPYFQAHLNAFAKGVGERRSAANSTARLDRLNREMRARGGVLEARFHRARGEGWLAELVLRDPDAAMKLATAGECSLTVEKLDTDEDGIGEPNPAVVALVCEHITAVAAAETTVETVDRYDALIDARRKADVASGMAAVRQLRDIGLLSFTESIRLLSDVLDPLVYVEIDADRECARLQAKIDELSGGRGRASRRRTMPEKARRIERRLGKRLLARKGLLLAMCLRRFGEHEAATLLIENPKEFERLEGEISLGKWDGSSVPESGGDGR
jgi:hypothetical protein